MVVVNALNCRLIDIFPGLCSSKHVVNLLTVKVHLVFEFLFNYENVRTRFAEEAEVVECLLCKQDVCASWAKEHRKH